MARYVIYGAGAIGGLIGARLALVGREVALLARGAHLEAIRRDGLRVMTPEADEVVRLPVAEHPSALGLAADDVIILAMKTQDAVLVLPDLAAAAPAGTAIVCAQNGTENERMALRRFERVYGALVYCSAALDGPGVVCGYNTPSLGVVDVGRYPAGVDETAQRLAEDLRLAGFDSVAQPDIMRWKRGKLILNSTTNAVRALVAAGDPGLPDLHHDLRAEIERCYRTAGLDYASREELTRRSGESVRLALAGGRAWPGGSTFQGMARGARTSEVDYLNGEITLLGRLCGAPTPFNAAVQQLMRDALTAGAGQGTFRVADIRERAAVLAAASAAQPQ